MQSGWYLANNNMARKSSLPTEVLKSHCLTSAEKNYSVTEREALVFVEGIKYYQPYLYDQRFTVHTDHNALQWLMNIKDPTGRLARWSLQIQQYDFDIKHLSGTHHDRNADALSGRAYPVVAAIDQPGYQATRIHPMQRRDPDLADIINHLEHGILPISNTMQVVSC